MSYGQPVAPVRPPPGWLPPFAGAPPPVPPGVNPQTWGAGAWHFNSAYQHPHSGQPPPQNTGWAPGYGWYGSMQNQSSAQAAGSYNPYKRVPRPPSAEYMASSLSDNPLGLTNMIPRYVSQAHLLVREYNYNLCSLQIRGVQRRRNPANAVDLEPSRPRWHGL
jgi:hypothetical protein